MFADEKFIAFKGEKIKAKKQSYGNLIAVVVLVLLFAASCIGMLKTSKESNLYDVFSLLCTIFAPLIILFIKPREKK